MFLILQPITLSCIHFLQSSTHILFWAHSPDCMTGFWTYLWFSLSPLISRLLPYTHLFTSPITLFNCKLINHSKITYHCLILILSEEHSTNVFFNSFYSKQFQSLPLTWLLTLTLSIDCNILVGMHLLFCYYEWISRLVYSVFNDSNLTQNI